MSVIPKKLALSSFASKRVRMVMLALSGIVLVAVVVGLVIKINQPDTEIKKTIQACQKVNKDETLCKFISSFNLDHQSYKLTISGTDSKGTKSNTTYLTDGKGNSSITTATSGQKTSWIIADKTGYLKNDAGQWVKFPKEAANLPIDNSPAASLKFSSIAGEKKTVLVTKFKRLGTEKCYDFTCQKYQLVDLGNKPTANYLWINTAGDRLYRYQTRDGQASSDMIFSYTAVNITAPANAKDFSQGAPAAQ